MKKSILVIAFLAWYHFAFGQQNFIANQYWLQMPMLNPAASGTKNLFELASGFRVNSEKGYSAEFGSPFYVRVDWFIPTIKSGFGFSYYDDYANLWFKYQPEYYYLQNFKFNYNTQIEVERKKFLSLGFNIDWQHMDWQLPWRFSDPPPAPARPADTASQNVVQMGFGGWYTTPNFYFGLSMLPIFKLVAEDGLYEPQTHWNMLGGYHFEISDDWKITPMVLVNYGTKASNMNLGVQFSRSDWLYFGVNANYYTITKTDYADASLNFFLGITILDFLGINYCYSAAYTETSSANTQNHSISLSLYAPKPSKQFSRY